MWKDPFLVSYVRIRGSIKEASLEVSMEIFNATGLGMMGVAQPYNNRWVSVRVHGFGFPSFGVENI